MERLLIIGCGDVALRTLPLLQNRYRLYALARDAGKFAGLRALGVTPVPGDLDDRRSLGRICEIADAVLHFVPPAGDARGDRRTWHLLAALSRRRMPTRLVYISTSGVYGDCGGELVQETHALRAQTLRSQLRASAERQIRVWAARNHVHAAILRVPGIYAGDRLPLERLRSGAPSIVAEQDSYSNHIHADDLARIVVAAMRHGRPNRVYHATDDDQMRMGDYFDAIADAHGLLRPPRLPRAEVQRTVSPMMWTFMSESRRLDNQRMKRELKVRLNYPTLLDFLEQRTKKEPGTGMPDRA